MFIDFKEVDIFTQPSSHFLSFLELFTPHFHSKIVCLIVFCYEYVEELGRERERNEGRVSKRERMVKSWIKRVVTVIVVI